jgi:hypothetical protein
LLPKQILCFFPQKERDIALTTWLQKKPADIYLYQGWSWQGAVGNIWEWRNCQSHHLLPGVVLPARLRLSIQTWQSDMIMAFQEIEQYCHEWELLHLSVITLITYSCIAGKYIILNIYYIIIILFVLFLYSRMTTAKIMPRLLF